MRVAVVGATGLVGTTMIKVLQERDFPISELIAVASGKSIGKTIIFRDKDVMVCSAEDALSKKPDIALFSAGADISKELAPRFAEIGCRVIDNSSCWRMDPTKKLIIPEINSNVLTKSDFIIANPNCSTIQMLLPIAPLHKKFNVKRIVVSTYQSISGTGYKALSQMKAEREGAIWGDYPAIYPYPIDKNILPHIDSFTDNGYTKEEMKMVNETHKILDPSIKVSVTTVRVPVTGGHSESVNIEFAKPFELEEIFQTLRNTTGVIVKDNPSKNEYPMPIHCCGLDDVFVGRIRRDFSIDNGLNMWVVADNLRKGAATNAVQIAEYLIKNII